MVVRSEEEAKYLLRTEIGELLHELAKRRPDLRDWAVKVQDCVFNALEEGKGGCEELEHIGDEAKHTVWLVIEKAMVAARCREIASKELDEREIKRHITIHRLKVGVLASTFAALLLLFYLPAPAVLAVLAAGILYSAVVAVKEKRQVLEPLKNAEVRKRTVECLNRAVLEVLAEIRRAKENLGCKGGKRGLFEHFRNIPDG